MSFEIIAVGRIYRVNWLDEADKLVAKYYKGWIREGSTNHTTWIKDDKVIAEACATNTGWKLRIIPTNG